MKKWRRPVSGRWRCRYLGHRYDPVDELIFCFKAGALNAQDLRAQIVCRRCQRTVRWDGRKVMHT